MTRCRQARARRKPRQNIGGFGRWPAVFAAALLALTQGQPIAAQSAGATRAAQDAAFYRLYANPSDPAAILEYARISVALRDFEAAASALERLVAQEPGNIPARAQLALAYFALGSNAMAERHFAIVNGAGGADRALIAQLQSYRQRAQARRAPSALTGNVSVGAVRSSAANANAQDVDLNLRWRYDLGGARGNHWLTSLNLSRGWQQIGSGLSDPYTVGLRTGPVVALGSSRQSAKLQGFALLSRHGDTEGDTTRRAGAGVQLQVPLSDRMGLTAEASAGQIAASYSTQDGHFTAQSLEVSFRPIDRWSLRLGATQEQRSGLSVGDETEQSARFEIVHFFRPSFSDVDRDWRLSASLEQNEVQSGGARTQSETSALALRGWVSPQMFSVFSIGRTQQDTGGTSGKTTQVGLRFGWEF